MLKLISIVLSFSLIFSSIAPSYAAGVSAQRQTQNLQASIEEAVAGSLISWTGLSIPPAHTTRMLAGHNFMPLRCNPPGKCLWRAMHN